MNYSDTVILNDYVINPQCMREGVTVVVLSVWRSVCPGSSVFVQVYTMTFEVC